MATETDLLYLVLLVLFTLVLHLIVSNREARPKDRKHG